MERTAEAQLTRDNANIEQDDQVGSRPPNDQYTHYVLIYIRPLPTFFTRIHSATANPRTLFTICFLCALEVFRNVSKSRRRSISFSNDSLLALPRWE